MWCRYRCVALALRTYKAYTDFYFYMLTLNMLLYVETLDTSSSNHLQTALTLFASTKIDVGHGFIFMYVSYCSCRSGTKNTLQAQRYDQFNLTIFSRFRCFIDAIFTVVCHFITSKQDSKCTQPVFMKRAVHKTPLYENRLCRVGME